MQLSVCKFISCPSAKYLFEAMVDFLITVDLHIRSDFLLYLRLYSYCYFVCKRILITYHPLISASFCLASSSTLRYIGHSISPRRPSLKNSGPLLHVLVLFLKIFNGCFSLLACLLHWRTGTMFETPDYSVQK